MDWTLFLIFLAGCGAAAATGAMFEPGEWYERLEKPSWTPPKWLFPVAWTTLYLFMSFAAMRIAQLEGNGHAMAFYALQLALNTLWTPISETATPVPSAPKTSVAAWSTRIDSRSPACWRKYRL